MEIVKIVRGNATTLALPLQQIEIVAGGTRQVEDFVFAAGDSVEVVLHGTPEGDVLCDANVYADSALYGGMVYHYVPTVSGNVLTFVLDADTPCGIYGVEVLITRVDGSRLRSYQGGRLTIVDSNEQAGITPDTVEFGGTTQELSASVFLFAKGDPGDKGDPGVGIVSVTKTGTSGLVDTYTILFTDGDSTTFTVTNGASPDMSQYYTKSESDTLLAAKAAKNGDSNENFSVKNLNVGNNTIYSQAGNPYKLRNISGGGDIALTSEIPDISGKADKALVVTLTQSGGSYTANKTYAEIAAAVAAGQLVEAAIGDTVLPFESLTAAAAVFAINVGGTLIGTFSILTSDAVQVDQYNLQEALVSGTNIKTINSGSILGSGDLALATASQLSNYCPIIEDTRSSAVAAITGVAPFAQLVDGQRIILHFAYKAANDGTLNLTLSGGTTTGAKVIKMQRRGGTAIDVLSNSYGLYVAGQYVEMIYNATDDIWVTCAPVDTNNVYTNMTQSDIDAGTGTVGQCITPKILCDNFAKVPTMVTVSSTGDVTQALDSGKFYKFGEIDSLTLTLTAASAGMSIYGGKFTTSADWTALALPVTVDEAAGNDTIAASKTYEFNIVDNVAVIKEV